MSKRTIILKCWKCHTEWENKTLETQRKIRAVLPDLSERERGVLTMRFGLDGGEMKTFEEVGRVFNVTRERIRQIESKALERIENKTRELTQ